MYYIHAVVLLIYSLAFEFNNSSLLQIDCYFKYVSLHING